MLVYENVFDDGKFIYIREFDTDSKTPLFSVEKSPKMNLFFEDSKGEYSSYCFNKKLSKKLVGLNEFREYSNSFKKTNKVSWGRTNLSLEWINQNYPDTSNLEHEFHTWFIDIEVTGKIDDGILPKDAWKPEFASQEISLIQIYDNFLEKFIVFSLKEYKGRKINNLIQKVYSKESDLLEGFINFIRESNPALLVGWNTSLYDYPYITNRIAKVLDKVKDIKDFNEVSKGYYVRSLSPFGKISLYHNEENNYIWNGILLEDYLKIYKKFTFNSLDSFSLSSVATYELGEDKVNHDEYSNFVEFYNKDFEKFYEYGLKDVELLVNIEKKLKLLQLCRFISYLCGCCISDIKGTLKQWNNYVYNECLKRNIILPTKSPYSKKENKFIGGIVHSTEAKWSWVSSFDFTSLYPSLISWMNLGGDTLYLPKENEKDLLKIQEYFLRFSPEEDTFKVKEEIIRWVREMFFSDSKKYQEIQETLKKYNLCCSSNGVFFRKDKKSIVAELVENLLIERQRIKKLMKQTEKEIEELKLAKQDTQEKQKLQEYYETTQISLKVMANSLYGVLSMEACQFAGSQDYFSNSITTTGQSVDVFCAMLVGDIVDKINNSLEEPLKDNSKCGLKWVGAMDTDSFYVSFEPLVKKLSLNSL